MAEPERRRRRLRPSSSSTPAAPVPPADDAPPVPSPGPHLTGDSARAASASAVTTEGTAPPPGAPTEAIADETPAVPAERPPRAVPPRRNGNGGGNGSPTDDREAERGLRGLVGSGSSQVSVGAALRARDAARPTDKDLADADRNLTIVRRNWVPREELPRNR